MTRLGGPSGLGAAVVVVAVLCQLASRPAGQVPEPAGLPPGRARLTDGQLTDKVLTSAAVLRAA